MFAGWVPVQGFSDSLFLLLHGERELFPKGPCSTVARQVANNKILKPSTQNAMWTYSSARRAEKNIPKT